MPYLCSMALWAPTTSSRALSQDLNVQPTTRKIFTLIELSLQTGLLKSIPTSYPTEDTSGPTPLNPRGGTAGRRGSDALESPKRGAGKKILVSLLPCSLFILLPPLDASPIYSNTMRSENCEEVQPRTRTTRQVPIPPSWSPASAFNAPPILPCYTS